MLSHCICPSALHSAYTAHLLFCSLILPTQHTSSSAPSCYLHSTFPLLLPHATYTAHLPFCSLILPTLHLLTCSLMLPTLHLPFCSPCCLHYTSICSLMLPTFRSAPSCYLTLNTSPCVVHTAYNECLSSHYSMLHTLHISLHPYCLGHTAQFYSICLPTLRYLWSVSANNKMQMQRDRV
jgi:hypothetical protein